MLLDQDRVVDDGEPAPRLLAPGPVAPAAVRRYGYETPGSSRLVGLIATAATGALAAIGLLVTLERVEHPSRVVPPMTVMLLPSEERPEPKAVATPKIVPKTAARPVPHETPLPPPIVTPPPTSLAVAAAQPAPIDPAPPKAEVAPTPAPAAPAAPPVQASHGPDKWEGRVLARLERFRRYPTDAQHARQQGTATIRFRIDRDGHVLSVKLERSSGYPALDDAALDTLRRADPLPKIPPDRPDQVELVVPIEFSIAR